MTQRRAVTFTDEEMMDLAKLGLQTRIEASLPPAPDRIEEQDLTREGAKRNPNKTPAPQKKIPLVKEEQFKLKRNKKPFCAVFFADSARARQSVSALQTEIRGRAVFRPISPAPGGGE